MNKIKCEFGTAKYYRLTNTLIYKILLLHFGLTVINFKLFSSNFKFHLSSFRSQESNCKTILLGSIWLSKVNLFKYRSHTWQKYKHTHTQSKVNLKIKTSHSNRCLLIMKHLVSYFQIKMACL